MPFHIILPLLAMFIISVFFAVEAWNDDDWLKFLAALSLVLFFVGFLKLAIFDNHDNDCGKGYVKTRVIQTNGVTLRFEHNVCYFEDK